ncbi:MAG: hypothetical protein KBD53_07455 [Candidatus Omnitrophica bacterium]|nr:hypothetical protein [Candidatus Omnitrophota bacterium]
MKNNLIIGTLSTSSGVIGWIVISELSGKWEAWDSSLYIQIFLPVMYVISLIFGYIEPPRAWRWGLFPFLGQFAGMILSQGFGNLWPLGLILSCILLIPGVILANVGAFLASKRK